MTRTLRLIIGSYTHSLPHVQARGEGISFVDLDTESGRFTPVASHPDIRNPSYLKLDGDLLYAVEELDADEATLTVFACDTAAARLAQRAKVPAHGAWPCHIGLDAGGTRLFLSNYLDGSFVTWPLDGGGLPHGAPTVLRRTGRGPNPERQDGPHAHFALASTGGTHVWICDAGTDEIVRYPLTEGGAVAAEPDLVLRAPPGSLPRHMTFSRDGTRLFVVSELGNLVSTWRFGPSGPELLGHVPTLAPGHAVPSSSAAIRLHPEGRFLYSSNRGDDSIAVFDTQTASGLPVFLATVPTGGRTPREFAISDDGRTMIVAHQDSHSLTVLRIEPDTGAISPLGGPFAIGSPVCVAICPSAPPDAAA
ncbi:6-phosphogluconolactonase [Pseudoxanthobacter soli DSM 19599]|uniref:6-phosphogluconolactonase n=1 Tax=Pseudoxanthobacter soli DSM 19599 TaxID=1123029 RepID=A0A1M7Z9X6_9HYPH|nr:lactonase family protein [Pseudoxanthobacter soli]SHO61728.1 6-phosphogluconolactonase [Pseudoxanthobacter soli DSM 19599]